jgi:hypothetical protein
MVSRKSSESLGYLETPFDVAANEALALEDRVFALQWAQLKHDEIYHRDIAILPIGERMKHFALHFTKYVGYLAEAIDSGDDRSFERPLVDAFVISLASANALHLDLGKTLASAETRIDTLEKLGLVLADQLNHPQRDDLWLLKQFARHSGKLAKACESLDHVESHPFRETMVDSVLCIIKVLFAEASVRGINIVKQAGERLREIESKHFLYRTRHTGCSRQ